jgi:hypothetical protein
MGRARDSYGVRRGAYRVVVGKPEGKRQLVRPRLRWGIQYQNESSRRAMGEHGLY